MQDHAAPGDSRFSLLTQEIVLFCTQQVAQTMTECHAQSKLNISLLTEANRQAHDTQWLHIPAVTMMVISLLLYQPTANQNYNVRPRRHD